MSELHRVLEQNVRGSYPGPGRARWPGLQRRWRFTYVAAGERDGCRLWPPPSCACGWRIDWRIYTRELIVIVMQPSACTAETQKYTHETDRTHVRLLVAVAIEGDVPHKLNEKVRSIPCKLYMVGKCNPKRICL
ncbi:hypothetical protein BDA96_06G154900 [Sorghum bicolor]|uniref:Uncharacterized protein n=1 Tax=Sorghum bicolor TaxID=4558 RepID=A0A921QQY3_SORBI|nr:hypothetical protein BDA96_06G154900 [Sorghum bicolor]